MVAGARMLGGELALEIRVLAKHGKGVREIAQAVRVRHLPRPREG
jgi:hypothetical protein